MMPRIDVIATTISGSIADWKKVEKISPLFNEYGFGDVKLIEVETADEMLLETQKNLPANVAVFSAAVADFKINKKYEYKIKKQDSLNLNLEKKCRYIELCFKP